MLRRLEVINLSKSFKKRRVLVDVSFHLDQGEVVGLLGPNGSGKSTSFYSVVGIVSPDKGSVVLNGKDVTHLPLNRRAQKGIGFLPQETSIFSFLTVEENILSALDNNPKLKNKSQRTLRLSKLLEQFSLLVFRDMKSSALSGGQRRRLEIARILSLDPDFILLDEPLVGIDPISVASFCEVILELKANGIGILITDHNLQYTLRVIDRAYVMDQGKILISGTADEIRKDPLVKERYLGKDYDPLR